MRKVFLLYAAVLLLFGAGISLLLIAGSGLQPSRLAPGERAELPSPGPTGSATAPSGVGGITALLAENVRHPLSATLLQVIVIMIAARAVGAIARKFGQPAVIGEMIAGILLGPSLLGMISPGAESFLFPPASMGTLQLLSQIGVILFMFVVGIELDAQLLREKAHAAVLVSHVSIIVPFFLGSALSLLLYRSLAPAGVPFIAFALFMGIAMSVTAFPVLARIIEERGLSKTHLGATAIACAAVDDVTAWCLLALVVAVVKADGLGGAALTVTLALSFTLIMLFGLKRPLGRAVTRAAKKSGNKGLLAGVLALVLGSALFTEIIGIHALFGAYLAGVVMPGDPGLRSFLRERLETFSSVFLLPLFFAFTGLRTQVGLLNDGRSWLTCAGIIAVALAGKLGASTLAARCTGMRWLDSLSIGALMNTRGLMELIALNIGYDLGILSSRIFAMMVLMALATTLMTGPLLARIEVFRQRGVELSTASATSRELP